MKFKKLENIMIFKAGENPNKVFLSEQTISDLNMFKSVPIVTSISNDYIIDEDDNYVSPKLDSIIGFISETTNIEFPYVYGNVMISEEYSHLTKFKNYQITVEDGGIDANDEMFIINKMSVNAIELE